MKYPRVLEGQWISPRRRGYRMMCCDCGLVHVLDFRLVRWGRGFKIQFRARRDDRATATSRVARRRKGEVVP